MGKVNLKWVLVILLFIFCITFVYADDLPLCANVCPAFGLNDTAECCAGFNSSVCSWNGSSCAGTLVTGCPDIINQTFCSSIPNCIWNESTVMCDNAPTPPAVDCSTRNLIGDCNSQTNQTICETSYVFTGSLRYANCVWVSGNCYTQGSDYDYDQSCTFNGNNCDGNHSGCNENCTYPHLDSDCSSAVCGNDVCESGEDGTNCDHDCCKNDDGNCPTGCSQNNDNNCGGGNPTCSQVCSAFLNIGDTAECCAGFNQSMCSWTGSTCEGTLNGCGSIISHNYCDILASAGAPCLWNTSTSICDNNEGGSGNPTDCSNRTRIDDCHTESNQSSCLNYYQFIGTGEHYSYAPCQWGGGSCYPAGAETNHALSCTFDGNNCDGGYGGCGNGCISPYNDIDCVCLDLNSVTIPYHINESTTLCNGTYNIDIVHDKPTNQDVVMVIDSNNTVLDCNGAILYGSPVGETIYINYGDNITIKNCNIHGYNNNINVQYSNNIHTLYGSFYNTSNAGVVYVYSTNSSIENSYFENHANAGVGILFGDHNTIKNSIFKGTNDILELGGIGIIFSNNNTIIGNSFESFNSGIILVSATSGDPSGSTNYNNITQNNFTNMSNFGIGFVDASFVNFGSTAGMDFNNNYVTKNNFINNNKGIYLLGGTNNNFTNNNFLSNVYAIVNNQTNDINVAGNYFGTTSCSVINSLIYDNNDNINLGIVTYQPFLNNNYPYGTSYDCNGIVIPVLGNSIGGSQAIMEGKIQAETEWYIGEETPIFVKLSQSGDFVVSLTSEKTYLLLSKEDFTTSDGLSYSKKVKVNFPVGSYMLDLKVCSNGDCKEQNSVLVKVNESRVKELSFFEKIGKFFSDLFNSISKWLFG